MEPYDFSDPSKKPPSMSSREWLWLKEGKKCHWCGCPTALIRVQRNDQATNDHVIPRGKGGSDTYDNVVSACHQCNQRRNHESNIDAPEGSLLGSFVSKVSPNPTATVSMKLVSTRPKVTVSRETLLIEQRDQAHKEIKRLREELELATIGWNAAKSLRDDAFRQMDRMNTMTFRRLAIMKLRAWIDRQKF